jgi:sugar phosphate isomerase/epimerase
MNASAVGRAAVQLYSLRERASEHGLERVLAEVADIGYAGVEVANLHGLAPATLRARLDALGLAIAAAHVSLPDAGASAALLDQYAVLGARDLVVAFLPPDEFETAAAVDRAADRLNEFARAAAGRGMALGYHNHFWEFSSRIDGESAHARLFRRLEPAVFAEIDTYWTKVGGGDPAVVVADFGARARLLHLKDGPADRPEAPMTALGEGRMDLPAILRASRAAWHIVELDRCATDMLTAIRASFAWLERLGRVAP